MKDFSKNIRSKSGYFLLIIVLVVEGHTWEGCFSASVDIKDFAGEWHASGKGYNPYSIRGVIEKGYYPVEYNLKIDSAGIYQLYYGSPGFLKLKRTGNLKSINSELILTTFDLSEGRMDHDILNVVVNHHHIESFCTHAIGSSIDGCHIEFNR